MSGSRYSLHGKVAVVTGSSRGIGRAAALALAAEGSNVVVNYLKDKEDAEETLVQLNRIGVESFVMQADVRVFAEAEKLVRSAVDKLGRIDILVNNAGIVQDRTLIKMSLDEWENVLRTDLTGVFHCSKAAAKRMSEQKSGRIINISSVVGQMGNFGQTNYAASKAGVLGFTKALARELADKGITVNAVCPGFVATNMVKRLSNNVQTELLRNIPLKRFGKPEEIADMIVFLASERSSYITGQAFNVNGGMLM
jgi:3-oxoacyl-[acyl-carrier protein] reductase